MKLLFRSFLILIAAYAVFDAPAAAAQYGGCYNSCVMTTDAETGEITSMYCKEADPLQWGERECEWVELDSNKYYCDIWGEPCCRDPYDI